MADDDYRYYDELPRKRTRDDDYDSDYVRGRQTSYGHRSRAQSRFGIASLILVLIAGALIFVCFSIAALITKDGDDLDENAPETYLLLLGAAIGLGTCAIGIILGVIGCIQRERDKACAIIGVALGGIVLVGSCGLMAVAAAVATSDM